MYMYFVLTDQGQRLDLWQGGGLICCAHIASLKLLVRVIVSARIYCFYKSVCCMAL